MADLTYEAVVKGMGGKARFTQRLAEIAAEMTGQGFGIKDLILSEPSELIVSNQGNVYSVVLYNIDMTGPGDAKGLKPSYLIGVSTDRGLNWKFIDGGGIAGDRAKLHQVLPDFPEKLVLPTLPEPQWKR